MASCEAAASAASGKGSNAPGVLLTSIIVPIAVVALIVAVIALLVFKRRRHARAQSESGSDCDGPRGTVGATDSLLPVHVSVEAPAPSTTHAPAQLAPSPTPPSQHADRSEASPAYTPMAAMTEIAVVVEGSLRTRQHGNVSLALADSEAAAADEEEVGGSPASAVQVEEEEDDDGEEEEEDDEEDDEEEEKEKEKEKKEAHTLQETRKEKGKEEVQEKETEVAPPQAAAASEAGPPRKSLSSGSKAANRTPHSRLTPSSPSSPSTSVKSFVKSPKRASARRRSSAASPAPRLFVPDSPLFHDPSLSGSPGPASRLDLALSPAFLVNLLTDASPEVPTRASALAAQCIVEKLGRPKSPTRK